jgi:NitT/TauT family transport system permease protein
MKTSLYVKAASLLAFALAWHLAALVVHNEIIFPPPLPVAQKVFSLAANGLLFSEFSVTALRTAAGLSLSLFFGVILGVAFGVNRRLYEFCSPLIVFFQSAPAISWILLAVIWVSASLTPVLLIVASTMPIIIINTSQGILLTDKKLLEMARVYSLPFKKIILKIYIPQVAGYVYSSMKIITGLAFKSAVMAEVLSYPENGIGMMMSRARFDVDTTALVAWTLIIVAAAYILDQIFVIASRKMNDDRN